MTDPTEDIRKQMLAEINAAPGSREYLEHKHGKVWDTGQLSEDFDVIGFAAPLVVVRRKSDGQKGSLMFQASPRFYFGFEAQTVTPLDGWEGCPPQPFQEVGSVTCHSSPNRLPLIQENTGSLSSDHRYVSLVRDT